MQDAIKELIKCTEKDGQILVDARVLYDFLEIGRDFSNWIRKMLDYGFEFGVDYTTIGYNYLGQEVENNGVAKKGESDYQQVTRRDYILAIDTAKEIAMIQRTPKGKQARQYFIDIEKRYHSSQKSLTPLELLAQQVQIAIQQERRLSVVEQKVDEILALGSKIPTNCLTVSGYAIRIKVKISIADAAKIGKMASRKCRELSVSTSFVHSEQYNAVKAYPIENLMMAFDDFFNQPPSRITDNR